MKSRNLLFVLPVLIIHTLLGYGNSVCNSDSYFLAQKDSVTNKNLKAISPFQIKFMEPTGEEIILSENFESGVFPPVGWHQEEVLDLGNYDDTVPEWYLRRKPYFKEDPEEHCAAFNSNSTVMSQGRLVTPPVNLSGYSYAFLNYHFYDVCFLLTGCAENNGCDTIQVQVSTDSINWINIGEPLLLNGCEEVWKSQSIDLTEYAGAEKIYISFLGKSFIYCADIYIDNVVVVAGNPIESAPEAETGSFGNLTGETVTLYAYARANASEALAYFEYDTSNAFNNSQVSDTFSLTGFYPQRISCNVENLIPAKQYFYRLKISNLFGNAVGLTNTFTTKSIAAPEINYFKVVGNDANEICVSLRAAANNSVSRAVLKYGLNEDMENEVGTTPETFTSSSYKKHDLTFGDVLTDTTYYYQIVVMNSVDTVFSAIETINTPKYKCYDTLMDGDIFFKAKYVNIGVARNGSLGANSISLVDLHTRMETEYWGLYGTLALTFDYQKNGWYTGAPGYIGDYFTPGYPEEGWGISIHGNDFNNNYNITDISGKSTDIENSKDRLIADWSGAKEGLMITQRIELPLDSFYCVVVVDLVNNTDSTVHDIFYMRTNDPDLEYGLSGNYSNFISIKAQNPDENNFAMISAKGKDYNSFLGLCANDKRARVFHGGTSNRCAKDIWEGNCTNERLCVDGDGYDDFCISLAYKIDSLEPGECTSLIYAYILSEDKLESALKSTMLEAEVDGGVLDGPKIELCSGGNTKIKIKNGEDYSWIWTDSIGNIVSTSNLLELENVTSNLTYHAAGNYRCMNPVYTFDVVANQYPEGVLNPEIQDIISGTAFESIAVESLTDIEEASYYWSRTSPEGIVTELPVSGVVKQGEKLEGVVFNSLSESEVYVDFTFIPVGGPGTFCKGDEMTATVVVHPFKTTLRKESVARVSVFPNPGNGKITIELNNDKLTSFKLTVMDGAGNQVFSENHIENASQVDLSYLNPGIYIAEIQTRNGVLKTMFSIY